ncbi:MAG: response regulator transcription factor [Armatimonas sp.]
MLAEEKSERRIEPVETRMEEGSDSGNSYRLFLVDDHCLLREGLRALIGRQKDLSVVGDASSGKAAYQKIGRLLPDLVLMDISMEGWNGIQTTERIKMEWPQIKVLVFSMHEERSYLRELFQAGASGYVLKSSSADEVLKAIRSTLRGGVYVDSKLGDSLLDLLRRPVSAPVIKGVALSEREEVVLKQVAQGYANKEIAAQLGISIKTVETHKARAMNKLALDSRVELIHYAMARGWLTNS